jgi:hypothetical protein
VNLPVPRPPDPAPPRRGWLRAAAPILLALAASGALVAGYLAAGGGEYAPTKVADACVPREWRSPKGVEKIAEQIALSAADGAACKLGASREELVAAISSEDRLNALLRRKGLSREDFDDLIRAGLQRSIDDAKRAGQLSGFEAFVLEQALGAVPIDWVLDRLRDAGVV